MLIEETERLIKEDLIKRGRESLKESDLRKEEEEKDKDGGTGKDGNNKYCKKCYMKGHKAEECREEWVNKEEWGDRVFEYHFRDSEGSGTDSVSEDEEEEERVNDMGRWWSECQERWVDEEELERKKKRIEERERMKRREICVKCRKEEIWERWWDSVTKKWMVVGEVIREEEWEKGEELGGGETEKEEKRRKEGVKERCRQRWRQRGMRSDGGKEG